MQLTKILSLLLLLSALSCKKEPEPNRQPGTASAKSPVSSVMILFVNYQTKAFAGGQYIPLAAHNYTGDYFMAKTTYVSPGDIGRFTVEYSLTGDTLFDATLGWMAGGSIHIPSSIMDPSLFAINPVQDFQPPLSRFRNILKLPNRDSVPIKSIAQLKQVEFYLDNNNREVVYFLYIPDYSFSEPIEWYWVIMMTR